MNLDLPATISAVTLLVSFISPIVVAVINNRHSERMERLKEYDRIRTQTVSEYIRNAGTAISPLEDNQYEKYRASYGEIFLYASPDLWDDIVSLDSLIEQIHLHDKHDLRDTAASVFSALCQSLSSDLSRKEQKKRSRKAN